MIFVFLIIEIKWELKKNNKHINSINFNYIISFLFSRILFYSNWSISNYSNNLSINASVKGPYGQIIEIFKNYYIYSPSKFFQT